LTELSDCITEWIRVTSSRIRRPSPKLLLAYNETKGHCHLGESIMDWMTREQPDVLTPIKEALAGVDHIRSLISSVLTSYLPSALHSIVTFYAI
jgi:hypothetical protein